MAGRPPAREKARPGRGAEAAPLHTSVAHSSACAQTRAMVYPRAAVALLLCALAVLPAQAEPADPIGARLIALERGKAQPVASLLEHAGARGAALRLRTAADRFGPRSLHRLLS